MKHVLLALFATILVGLVGWGCSSNQQVDYKNDPALTFEDKQLVGAMHKDADKIAEIDQKLKPLVKDLDDADADYIKADDARTLALNRIKAVNSNMYALAVELGIKPEPDKASFPISSLTKHRLAYVRPEDVIVLQDLTAVILSATSCHQRPDAEHSVLIGYDEKGILFVLVPHTVNRPNWNPAQVLNAEILKPNHQPLRLLPIAHVDFERVK